MHGQCPAYVLRYNAAMALEAVSYLHAYLIEEGIKQVVDQGSPEDTTRCVSWRAHDYHVVARDVAPNADIITCPSEVGWLLIMVMMRSNLFLIREYVLLQHQYHVMEEDILLRGGNIPRVMGCRDKHHIVMNNVVVMTKRFWDAFPSIPSTYALMSRLSTHPLNRATA